MDFKKALAPAFFVFIFLGTSLGFWGAEVMARTPVSSYSKILKQWTRSEKVYVWDNFEARLIWHATYFSPDFREARRRKLNGLYEWNPEERSRRVREDLEESRKEDVFFVSIYAGSNEWPEVGKDTGKWKIVLEPEGGKAVESLAFERVPVTQVERNLFPYLDHWSKAYRLSFPKVIREGRSFRLRVTGIPAKSELLWK